MDIKEFLKKIEKEDRRNIYIPSEESLKLARENRIVIAYCWSDDHMLIGRVCGYIENDIDVFDKAGFLIKDNIAVPVDERLSDNFLEFQFLDKKIWNPVIDREFESFEIFDFDGSVFSNGIIFKV